MKKLTALLALLQLLPSVHAAELPELFVPAPDEVVARLMRPTNFGLRSQLYSARRHRIVTLNLDVLSAPGGEFTITPFEDLPMRVRTLSFDSPPPDEWLARWQGEVLEPQVNRQGFDHLMRPIQLQQHPLSLAIRSVDQVVPASLLAQLAVEQPSTIGFGTVPRGADRCLDAMDGQVTGKLFARTAGGTWWLWAWLKTIVVQTIAADPRYHVVYEQDPDKVRYGTPDEMPKVLAQQEFMDALNAERAAYIASCSGGASATIAP